MKIQFVEDYFKVAQDLKLNLMLIGAHGRAKTKSVSQYKDSINYDKLITVILSRMEPTDMLGLPITTTDSNGTVVTSYASPYWLEEACKENQKTILFFDEYPNAEIDVQNAILNLIEERESEGKKLAETTQIILAGNPPSINHSVRELSKPVRDRMCVLTVDDDKISYQKYYTENGMDILSDLLEDFYDAIPNYDEDCKAFANKNAEFTYRSLEKAYNIAMYCKENKISKTIAKEMIVGYGGAGAENVADYIIEKVKHSEEKNELYDKIGKEDIDTLIEYLQDNEIMENAQFIELARIADHIKSSYSNEDFEKCMNTVYSNEFKELYNINNNAGRD